MTEAELRGALHLLAHYSGCDVGYGARDRVLRAFHDAFRRGAEAQRDAIAAKLTVLRDEFGEPDEPEDDPYWHGIDDAVELVNETEIVRLP